MPLLRLLMLSLWLVQSLMALTPAHAAPQRQALEFSDHAAHTAHHHHEAEPQQALVEHEHQEHASCCIDDCRCDYGGCSQLALLWLSSNLVVLPAGMPVFREGALPANPLSNPFRPPIAA